MYNTEWSYPLCPTDFKVLTETEILHMPLMGLMGREKTSRTESWIQHSCRKKEIPTDVYSCPLHKWFALHETHFSAISTCFLLTLGEEPAVSPGQTAALPVLRATLKVKYIQRSLILASRTGL